jgi:hypothetical protein
MAVGIKNVPKKISHKAFSIVKKQNILGGGFLE